MLRSIKARITDSVAGLFAHGTQPLQGTARFPGDRGLCGPGSVSWKVIGDVSAFLGGIRALLIQSAHPEVVAGVEDHSSYREDPLGRLNRTSYFVTTATFGAMPEVESAVGRVRAAHRGVAGLSSRNLAYSASTPELAAWVHNTLTDSFLVAYREFGLGLTAEEADRFVAEQTRIGEMLDADPLPATAAELGEWVRSHPALEPSPGMRSAVEFLRRPPIPTPQRWGYRVLMQGAAVTIPPEVRTVLEVEPGPGARPAAAALVRALRWAMRNSPAWKASLERCGEEYDARQFRRFTEPRR
ncbi:MAG: oxygenase MpaB family protein [bacterium]|nr:oxygenase MpaB family protein [bacterium]